MTLINSKKDIISTITSGNPQVLNAIINAISYEEVNGINTNTDYLILAKEMEKVMYSYIDSNIINNKSFYDNRGDDLILKYRTFLLSLLHNCPLEVFSNKVLSYDNRMLAEIFGKKAVEYIDRIRTTYINKARMIDSKINAGQNISFGDLKFLISYITKNYNNISQESIEKYYSKLIFLLRSNSISLDLPILKFMIMHNLRTSNLYYETRKLMNEVSEDDDVEVFFSSKLSTLGKQNANCILLNKQILGVMKYDNSMGISDRNVEVLVRHLLQNKNTEKDDSMKNIGFPRTIQVLFHELAHVKQYYSVSSSKITDTSVQQAVHTITRNSFPADYDDNYFQQRTEIEAESLSWKETLKWLRREYFSMYSDSEYVKKIASIFDTVFVFQNKDNTREGLGVKYAGHQDLNLLLQAIKKDPIVLEEYPFLKSFINDEGTNIDINKVLFKTPAAAPKFIRDCVTFSDNIDKVLTNTNLYVKEATPRERFNCYNNLNNSISINFDSIKQLLDSESIRRSIKTSINTQSRLSNRIGQLLKECNDMLRILMNIYELLLNHTLPTHSKQSGEIAYLSNIIKKHYTNFNEVSNLYKKSEYYTKSSSMRGRSI